MTLYHGKNATVYAWSESAPALVDELTPALRAMSDLVTRAGLSMEEFSRAMNQLTVAPTITGRALVRRDDAPPLPRRAFALDGVLP